MNKKNFLILSIFIIGLLIAIIICYKHNSLIVERRPASWTPKSWTVKRAISYFNHFRPVLSYDKKTVEESQLGDPYYSVHNNMLYHGDDMTKTYVEGADIDSFFPLIGPYGLDHYALYVDGIRYPVDTGSLIIYRDGGYIASSGIVYNINREGEMKPLTGANPDTFMPLPQTINEGEIIFYSSMYAKDDRSVYFQDKVFSGVEPDTFTLLPFAESKELIVYRVYSKDDKFIYYKDQIITGADYDTFELTSSGTGQDKNHTYRNGKIVQ